MELVDAAAMITALSLYLPVTMAFGHPHGERINHLRFN